MINPASASVLNLLMRFFQTGPWVGLQKTLDYSSPTRLLHDGGDFEKGAFGTFQPSVTLVAVSNGPNFSMPRRRSCSVITSTTVSVDGSSRPSEWRTRGDSDAAAGSGSSISAFCCIACTRPSRASAGSIILSAISRNAITAFLSFSASIVICDPFASARARCTAKSTSSNLFGTLSTQSSTVTRAMSFLPYEAPNVLSKRTHLPVRGCYRSGERRHIGFHHYHSSCFMRALFSKNGYITAMSTFDYTASAELFALQARSGIRYQRFAQAAEAIRHAIEKLPPKVLAGSSIEVNDRRYNAAQIRALYESERYPLSRNKPLL